MPSASFASTYSRAAQELAASPSLSALRLTMVRGETLRLPRWASSLRVARGLAWVGSGRDEAVLSCGESLRLPRRARYPVLASAIGDGELLLVLERRA